jgi:tripartite-type tricarboxylate transporter receptor subunit TctC
MKSFLLALGLLISQSVIATEFTVHHAPGGPSDRATRLIAKYLPSEYVVVNRPGAGGRIATKHLIKNNSLMLATSTQIFVTNLISEIDSGYEPIRDLEVIGTAAIMPNVLACRSNLKLSSFKEINDRTFNFGVAGIGSSEHIATEILFTRINGKHQSVPYAQGGSTAIVDMLAGNLDCMFANYPTIKPFIDDKRITVLFSSHNLGLNVPTWQDIYGESFPFSSYLSLIISKQMTTTEKQKIINDVTRVFDNAEFRLELKSLGLFVIASTSRASTIQVERANAQLFKFITNNKISIQ